MLTKLVRDRLYDAASLLLTPKKEGKQGEFTTPAEELSFRNFAASLSGHASAFARMQE